MFEDLDGGGGYVPPSANPPARSNYGQSETAAQQEQRPPGGYQAAPGGYAQPPAAPVQASAQAYSGAQGGGYNTAPAPSGYQAQKEYRPRPQGGGGYGGGGYGGGGGGGGGFARKEDVLQDTYLPVAFHVEKDFPEEVKATLFNLASKMIAKKMTVRINADDKEFIDRLKTLTDDKLEVYLPWRGFNEIESKRTFNTITCKTVASSHFAGWEKIPDSVKAILACQVRMIFGDRNNSITLCLITWTRDGASKPQEVSKDTGRASFVIKMASSYGFPVLNVQRPQVAGLITNTFSL